MRIVKTLLFIAGLIFIGTLFAIPVSATTYTWQCGEDVKAYYNSTTGDVHVYGTGDMYNDWVSPNYAGMKKITIGDGVTSIGPKAFSGLHINYVGIADTVKKIGNGAFEGCEMLTTVKIPNSVTSLGDSTFAGCSSLSNVTLGTSVTEIPDYAFSQCISLTEIKIHNGITRIGVGAFNLSGIQSVDLPDTVTIVDEGAFSACRSMKTVDLGVAIEKIGNEAFYDTIIETIELPNTLTYIGGNAFKSCDYLKTISLKNGLTYIGQSAFSECISLEKITIPETVEFMGENTFENCKALETVNYNALNCSTMGTKVAPAFYNCSMLKHINIGTNVKKIPSYAFFGCETIEEILFPKSITEMGTGVIGECNSLKILSIPFIGSKRGENRTFESCLGYIFDAQQTLYSSSNGNMVSQNYLGNQYCTFYMPTSLRKIVISDTDTIACNSLSGLHSVTEIVLPDGLSVIDTSAFEFSADLKSITIPKTVTSIGDDAFYGCDKLEEVHYGGNKEDRMKVRVGFGNEKYNKSKFYYNVYTSTQRKGNSFIVTPTGIIKGNVVIFACYEKERVVHIEMYTYLGEEELVFSTDKECDFVKILVWEDMKNIYPVCKAEGISIE